MKKKQKLPAQMPRALRIPDDVDVTVTYDSAFDVRLVVKRRQRPESGKN